MLVDVFLQCSYYTANNLPNEKAIQDTSHNLSGIAAVC